MNKRQETTFGGNPVTLCGTKVSPGEKAKDFVVLDQDLKAVHLSDFKNKIILISVVPSIDTGVCEIQTKEFNKQATELGDDVVVMTISCDLPFAQKRFCAAEGINRALIFSDHKDLDFGEKYGFVIEELRLLNRGIVVINRDGNITYVEYVSENTNHPDYDKAIEAVRALI